MYIQPQYVSFIVHAHRGSKVGPLRGCSEEEICAIVQANAGSHGDVAEGVGGGEAGAFRGQYSAVALYHRERLRQATTDCARLQIWAFLG